MENIIVASTNLYGLRALSTLFHEKSYTKLIILLCAVTASTVYHLFEKSKHKMPGLPPHFSDNTLLQIDRLFASLSVIYFVAKTPLSLLLNPYLISCTLFGLLMLAVSELPEKLLVHQLFKKYNKLFTLLNNRTVYIITHSLWHITAYHCAYLLSI